MPCSRAEKRPERTKEAVQQILAPFGAKGVRKFGWESGCSARHKVSHRLRFASRLRQGGRRFGPDGGMKNRTVLIIPESHRDCSSDGRVVIFWDVAKIEGKQLKSDTKAWPDCEVLKL